uniref:Alpha/beta hydrolase n=1 Tax=Geoglobus ahangari TaxID=113653 RepID=A0A7C3UCD4_9EURY
MEIIVGGIRGTYTIKGEGSALLCPPHPLMGGSRFDIRLERICEGLHQIGYSTLRFDYKQPFRNGLGEVEDARIMLRYLKERHNFVAVIGYSFGSVVASNIADEADAVVLISPLKKINKIELRDSKKPKLIIYGTYDEIVSVKESREITEKLSPPKEVVELETDHFYTGTLDILTEKIVEFLKKC